MIFTILFPNFFDEFFQFEDSPKLNEENSSEFKNISSSLIGKLVGLFILFNDEHSENISSIYVTLLVLKLERFKSSKDEQP